MKFKIVPGDTLGPVLRSELNNILGGVNAKIDAGLADLMQQARGKVDEMASSRLYRTRQQYTDAIQTVQIAPNKWAIILDASATHLEEGYPSFDMKPGLLGLGKNLPTPTNGSKGIRVSKEGFRYRVIPIDINKSAGQSDHPLNGRDIQHQNPVTKNAQGELQRPGGPQGLQTMGDLASDAKALIKKTRLSGITKDATGKAILGKVATVMGMSDPNKVRVKDSTGNSTIVQLGNSLGGRPNKVNPLLTGMIKQQYEVKTKSGKTQVKSAYMVFRVVSEKQAGKWIHSGFMGARIFPDLEAWADRAMGKMVEDILKSSA